jgi:hypothetical protein
MGRDDEGATQCHMSGTRSKGERSEITWLNEKERTVIIQVVHKLKYLHILTFEPYNYIRHHYNEISCLRFGSFLHNH